MTPPCRCEDPLACMDDPPTCDCFVCVHAYRVERKEREIGRRMDRGLA